MTIVTKQAADPQPAGFCTCLCLVQPQTGDIIFQISRSSQSKAIQLATHSDYSHTGTMVIRRKSRCSVAVGPEHTASSGLPMVKGQQVVRRVEQGAGLKVEEQQKLAQTAKRYLVNRMISALMVATIASTVRKWCGRFTRTRWDARGRTEEVERV